MSRFGRKFINLESYDFYSDKEESEKTFKKRTEKYIWKTEKSVKFINKSSIEKCGLKKDEK